MYKTIFRIIVASSMAGLGVCVYGQLSSAPNEVLYVQQLPDLNAVIYSARTNAASVLKIDLMTTRVTVVYQYPNGQISTVVYKPISEAGTENAPVATNAVYTPTPSAPAVIYEPVPVYYPYYVPVNRGRDRDHDHDRDQDHDRDHFHGDSHRDHR